MKSESKIKINDRHSLKARVSQMKNMKLIQHYFIFLSIFLYFCDAISFQKYVKDVKKLTLNKSIFNKLFAKVWLSLGFVFSKYYFLIEKSYKHEFIYN